MHVNDLLKIAVDASASDLHLKVGSYPMMRVRGTLMTASTEKRLDHEDVVAISAAVMSTTQRQKFKETQEVDLAYSVPGLGRFRCNIFQQRGTVGLVLRVIPMQIRTIDELGLPPVLKTIAEEERGLVLVTGTTGSGKSTTLAAMIDHINKTRPAHVMTVEDPIEFLHRDNRVDGQPARGRGRHAFLRPGAPQRPASGSRRDSGRRNARLRDDRDRTARRGNRAPGAVDAAHARRHRNHQPHHRGVSRRTSRSRSAFNSRAC